jgi:flavorubredoxin
MAVREIVPGVSAVGANDWDRRMFDALVPLPDGTSYNSYVVKGTEKTALIDTVDPTKEYELICNLVKMGVDGIDYVVAHHAEQDHSGTLPMILELFPQAKVLCTGKCRDLLVCLLEIDPDRCQVVADKDTVSLGGKTLEFIEAPWVHWPETMFTYVKEDRLLFTCDLFGSHYAASDLFAGENPDLYPAAKRYYAEIMMPFRKSIVQHMEKLGGYDIAIVAPSHGPLHAPPDAIFSAYRDWTSDGVKNEVVIPFVSMHGSTRKMVDYLADSLVQRGITVRPLNLETTDSGALGMALVDAATVVVACPTVLFGPHPHAVSAVYLINILRPKTRFMAIIGSYGWGGQAVETITGLLTHLKPEILEPVYINGTPDAKALKQLDLLAGAILEKHRAAGIIQ